MKDLIRISGKEEGPWDVEIIENELLHSNVRPAKNFPELCLTVSDLLLGRCTRHGIEYQGPDGVLGEKQRNILYGVVGYHNQEAETQEEIAEMVIPLTGFS